MSFPLEVPEYEFVGWGPAATGSRVGWATRSDLFGRGPHEFMQLMPGCGNGAHGFHSGHYRCLH
jgi:hypothetical protein